MKHVFYSYTNYFMPISIPVMYLLNGVRQRASSLQQAKQLSSVWWLRVMGYSAFGTSLLISQDHLRLSQEYNIINDL